MTEEILQDVQKNRKVKRDVGTSVTKLKQQIKRLKRKNKESENDYETSKKKLKRIRKERNLLVEDVSRLRKDNTNLLTSFSWRATRPLRTLRGKIKNKR